MKRAQDGTKTSMKDNAVSNLVILAFYLDLMLPASQCHKECWRSIRNETRSLGLLLSLDVGLSQGDTVLKTANNVTNVMHH